jgi:hypothetical protein
VCVRASQWHMRAALYRRSQRLRLRRCGGTMPKTRAPRAHSRHARSRHWTTGSHEPRDASAEQPLGRIRSTRASLPASASGSTPSLLPIRTICESYSAQASRSLRFRHTGSRRSPSRTGDIRARCDPTSGKIFSEKTERGGFEPPNEVSPVTRFPVAPVQPLRHLSSTMSRRSVSAAAPPRLRHRRPLRW